MNDGKSQISVSSDGITYLSIYKNPVCNTLLHVFMSPGAELLRPGH